MEVSGLPLELIRDFVNEATEGRAGVPEEVRGPCRCSLKTALVPAQGHEFWREVMDHTPFGGSAVKDSWPYLGAAVTSLQPDAGPEGAGHSNAPMPGGERGDDNSRRQGSGGAPTPGTGDPEQRPGTSPEHWGEQEVGGGRPRHYQSEPRDVGSQPQPPDGGAHADEMLNRIAADTWRKSAGTAGTRAAQIGASGASLGRRCQAWNTFVISLIPYPGHVIPPDAAAAKAYEAALGAALQPTGARWCPLYALTALGAAEGIKGAPKCPAAVALAVGAGACIRRRAWGPPRARAMQEAPWLELTTWAHGMMVGAGAAGLANAATLTADAAKIRAIALGRFHNPDHAVEDRVGGTLYRAAWMALHGAN